jgi:cell division septation protein DedD
MRDEMTNIDNDSNEFQDDELFDEPVKKFSSVTVIIIALAITALAATSWYIYDSYKEKSDNEMLLITAEEENIKVQPIEPGGMIVDNMDKSVYDAISGENNQKSLEPKVEVLLQPSEEPIDKSTILAEESVIEEDDLVEIPPKKTHKKELIVKEEEIKTPTKVIVDKSPTEKTIVRSSESDDVYIKPVSKKTTAKPKFAKQTDNNFYKVQLASFKSSSDAEQEWNNLLRKYSSLLKDYKHYIVSKDITGKGLFYRLQVGPFKDKKSAKEACEEFKSKGMSCLIAQP